MKKKSLIKVALLPFLIHTAYATDDNVFTLGEVKVNADAKGSSIGSTSIDLDEMREQDRSNVATALNLEPGVYFTKGGARNEQMVNVRGFDLRQVPIYMDGIPIYVPYDGYVDLARFSTMDLSRIEVSKGYSSALYGANTLGGAINLVSRRPSKEFEGEVGGGITFGDRGGVSGQQMYTNLGTNRGTWYMQAGVSYSNQDFYTMSDNFKPVAAEDGGKRNHSDQNDSRINLKIGVTPNATDEYAFNYISQKGAKATPPYTGTSQSTQLKYWDWPYWDKDSLYFLSKTEFGNHTFRVRAYHDTFRNSLYIYTNAAYTTLSSSNKPSFYNDFTNGISLQDDIRLSNQNTLKVSYNIKNDVHRENTTTTPVIYFEDKLRTLAAEDTHQITEALSLNVGVSHETQETPRAFDSGTNAEFEKPNHSANNGQAAILYQLDAVDQLHASVARKSRFATIKDRYSYRFGTAIPNANLQPERATNYEVGYQHKAGQNWLLTANVFYSNITDLIQSTQINATQTQMQNIGKVDVNGLELGANGSIGSVDVGTNYTYLDRKNRSNSLLLTDTPRQKLFSYATWNINDNWKLNGSVEASTQRYSSSTIPQAVAPGFAVVNTKASYKFSDGLLVEGGIRNLFDKNYMYSEGFPEAGRTYFVQFNMPL